MPLGGKHDHLKSVNQVSGFVSLIETQGLPAPLGRGWWVRENLGSFKQSLLGCSVAPQGEYSCPSTYRWKPVGRCSPKVTQGLSAARVRLPGFQVWNLDRVGVCSCLITPRSPPSIHIPQLINLRMSNHHVEQDVAP